METIKSQQLNLMLVLIGISGMLVVFAVFTRSLSRKRRRSLIWMEASATLLLIADRYAYIFRGDVTRLGYYMVRITNFLVFVMTLLVMYGFIMYISDLYLKDGNVDPLPIRLKISRGLVYVGIALIIFSQYTGLYYTFDASNHYRRSHGFLVCYIIPIVILLLNLSVIIQYYNRLNRTIGISLLLFSIAPLITSVIQIFVYGLSLINIVIVGTTITTYLFALIDINDKVADASRMEIELLKNEQKNLELVFEQTAQALANAIDAKDKYTHGHSMRVAEYSEKIARETGFDEVQCKEVYYAGLLHDVGKIGIPDSIINKEGKLTNEEFDVIKTHPVIGNQILSSISRSPYLSVGAHHHHERYDGKGYPDHLKGEDIPALARIIAVADAYDAMTSKRSYRDPIPQQKVREEFVKGMGTQFDPHYAEVILRLIDMDTKYEMKEREEVKELAGKSGMSVEGYRDEVSEGIIITSNMTHINMRSNMLPEHRDAKYLPSIIIFDSLDAHVHFTEAKKKDLLYLEYAVIRFDGKAECVGARKLEKTITDHREFSEKEFIDACEKGIDFTVNAVRIRDHLRVMIECGFRTVDVTIALNDSVRFAYIGLTGEYCEIRNVSIDKDEEKIPEDYIERIADEVSYIDGPEGVVPNVQIDGWRAAATKGIPVTNEMRIVFHSMSLPTARLVWHCPYVSIFSSDDGEVNGVNFREYVLVRLDGENWESDEWADNKIFVNKSQDFEGWDVWKQKHKEGLECEVSITRKGNRIIVFSENCGISVTSITTLNVDVDNIYVALTGDQCAITNVRVME